MCSIWVANGLILQIEATVTTYLTCEILKSVFKSFQWCMCTLVLTAHVEVGQLSGMVVALYHVSVKD